MNVVRIVLVVVRVARVALVCRQFFFYSNSNSSQRGIYLLRTSLESYLLGK